MTRTYHVIKDPQCASEDEQLNTFLDNGEVRSCAPIIVTTMHDLQYALNN